MKTTEKMALRCRDARACRPAVIACLGDSVTHGCFELVDLPDGRFDTTYRPHEGYAARLQRRLKGSWRRRVEAYCFQTVRQDFAHGAQNLPDPGTVYRTFQVEASQTGVSRGRARKIVYGAVCALLIVLMGGIFWLTAVLIQPPEIRPDEPAAEETVPQNGWDASGN